MTFKPLYEFVLPALNNAGTQNYDRERWQFETDAAEVAGGYTYLGLHVGGWKAGDKVQREPVHVYHVAAFSQERDELVKRAFKRYPDQASLFVAEIGLADIIDAPAKGADWQPLPADPEAGRDGLGPEWDGLNAAKKVA